MSDDLLDEFEQYGGIRDQNSEAAEDAEANAEENYEALRALWRNSDWHVLWTARERLRHTAAETDTPGQTAVLLEVLTDLINERQQR